MRFGASAEDGRVSKLTYACYLAACLTYFSSLQRDRVGMATIDHDIVDYVPPSAKHLRLVLHSLDRIERGARDAKVDAGQVDAAGAAAQAVGDAAATKHGRADLRFL